MFAHTFSRGLAVALVLALAASRTAAEQPKVKFLDLSLLVSQDHPCTWPAGFAPFQINHYLKIGPASPYNSDVLLFDENTATQFDAPSHSVTPPDSGKPNAGKFGTITGDKVPPWQFAGEACIIDCRMFLGTAPKGRSDLITKEHVIAWEKKHRPLTTGDVVLFRSDYTDKYYRPFPEGRLFLADPLEGKSQAWPDPDPDCMEYLATRKVMSLGTDSPSMGPIPGIIGDHTHYAGLKHGMMWTEAATRLGELPTTGAFYCILGPQGGWRHRRDRPSPGDHRRAAGRTADRVGPQEERRRSLGAIHRRYAGLVAGRGRRPIALPLFERPRAAASAVPPHDG